MSIQACWAPCLFSIALVLQGAAWVPGAVRRLERHLVDIAPSAAVCLTAANEDPGPSGHSEKNAPEQMHRTHLRVSRFQMNRPAKPACDDAAASWSLPPVEPAPRVVLASEIEHPPA